MKKLYHSGNTNGLKRGPLLKEDQPYYWYSGQAYMVIDSREVYFMTGKINYSVVIMAVY